MSTVIIARIFYRHTIGIDVELIEGEGPRSFILRCPMCETRSKLNEGRHCVSWNMTAGQITVEPSVLCPKPACGWHVNIRQNIARDVDEALPDPPKVSPFGPGDPSYARSGYRPRLPGSRRG